MKWIKYHFRLIVSVVIWHPLLISNERYKRLSTPYIKCGPCSILEFAWDMFTNTMRLKHWHDYEHDQVGEEIENENENKNEKKAEDKQEKRRMSRRSIIRWVVIMRWACSGWSGGAWSFSQLFRPNPLIFIVSCHLLHVPAWYNIYYYYYYYGIII